MVAFFLLVLYFLKFHISSLLGKKYFTKLDQYSAGSACFWPLRAGAGAAWEKNQNPELL